MRYDETTPKMEYKTATQVPAPPTDPGLNDKALETLKWLNELGANLEAIERNLFGGPEKPNLTPKDVPQPYGLDERLRVISQQVSGMVGFTSGLLNRT